MITIDQNTVCELLGVEPASFPTYVGPLLNLANRFSRATRPPVVGQMTDLIKEANPDTFEEWKCWYLERWPGAIDDAADRMMEKLERFKEVLAALDEDTVYEWLYDLIVVKTYQGLQVQDIVIQKVAEQLQKPWRCSTSNDEARGIDGFIGETPVSVKPSTITLTPNIKDKLPDCIIIYTKTSAGLRVTFDETSIR
jgi:hypothetical protein